MEWRYYEWKEVIKKRTSQANTSRQIEIHEMN